MSLELRQKKGGFLEGSSEWHGSHMVIQSCTDMSHSNTHKKPRV